MTPPSENVAEGFARAVFKAGGRLYTLEQVIQAADYRGDLHAFQDSWHAIVWRANLAAQRGLEPDEAAVQDLVREYRYQRDLTSAEECEQWLEARGLTPDNLEEYVVRRYWSNELADELMTSKEPTEVNAKEHATLFRIDLLLSEEFDRFARRLAWRVACACEEIQKNAAPDNSPCPGLMLPGISSSSQASGPPSHWRKEVEQFEAAFRAHSQRLLTTDNRRRWLSGQRLSLLGLELEIMELDNETAAREAFLCVQQDGATLSELALQAGYPLRQASCLMADLPDEWQEACLSASPGTALPPFARPEGFDLCFLKAKREPGLDDPQVIQRLDLSILRQHFLELEARHVQWLLSIETSA
jgi:hypothetical protein